MILEKTCRCLDALIASAVFVLCISGCGPKDQFPTFRAEGSVTLNGNPLSDAHVWLIPKEKAHQESTLVVRPQGRTNAEGKFVLTTYLENDGAPEGSYDAIVLHGENDPDAASEEARARTGKNFVPAKYKDASTSGLRVVIQKVPNANSLSLELKSK